MLKTRDKQRKKEEKMSVLSIIETGHLKRKGVMKHERDSSSDTGLRCSVGDSDHGKDDSVVVVDDRRCRSEERRIRDRGSQKAMRQKAMR